MNTQWMKALTVVALTGCVQTSKPDIEPMAEGDGGGAETSVGGEGGSSTGEDPGMTSAPGTTVGSGGESSSSGGGDDDGCHFICTPDTPPGECDVWAQDCQEGQKCMPWANDGGSSWNSLKCVDVAQNAGQPGDECHVEGSGVSGIDDCALGAMCWNVNEEGLGTCVAFCGGTPASPVCEDPNASCVIANDGVLTLCLPTCDPLLQDCDPGQACYPVDDGFACGPDASGEMGGFGDPCEFLNVCDPGLFCANAAAVPGCAGSNGCCTNFCEFSQGNAQCTGQGQECVQWYDAAAAPPGLEDVGACLIPE
ncbi:MAG: ribulose phosphate epimerase [Nannocystaceae bacterium]|jgi:hypothetical protein